MAVKTITITVESYDRLKSLKAENESFSQTILRLFKPPADLNAWFAKLETIGQQVTPGFFTAMDTVLGERENPDMGGRFDELPGHKRPARSDRKKRRAKPSGRERKSATAA